LETRMRWIGRFLIVLAASGLSYPAI